MQIDTTFRVGQTFTLAVPLTVSVKSIRVVAAGTMFTVAEVRDGGVVRLTAKREDGKAMAFNVTAAWLARAMNQREERVA